jgi:hypothetical protein
MDEIGVNKSLCTQNRAPKVKRGGIHEMRREEKRIQEG